MSSTNRIQAETPISVFRMPLRAMFFFWMVQVINMFSVPLSASIVLLWSDLSPVVNAGSCMFFLFVIIYTVTLSRHVIHWIHQSQYFHHVKLHKRCSALFIFWNACSIHATLLKSTFCHVDPHIEKRREALEYLQCRCTQWCNIPEVLGGNVPILTSLEDFRVQSLTDWYI